MKKALAIAGILALSITPIASFADHLEPIESQIKRYGNLGHTNLRGQSLSGADLSGARLILANLSGAKLFDADRVVLMQQISEVVHHPYQADGSAKTTH